MIKLTAAQAAQKEEWPREMWEKELTAAQAAQKIELKREQITLHVDRRAGGLEICENPD